MGVKALCILATIPHFNIIDNIPFDYMHGLYLGVAKLLVNLWFDSSHSSQEWSIRKFENSIDQVYTSIKVKRYFR